MTDRSGGVGLSDIALLGGALVTVLLLLAPVPGVLLDVLLALNLGGAVLLLATAARSSSPPRALPSALLLATVARLAIEVAATRAILTRGDAGALIPAVGRAALGGNWVVGTAVFVVLVSVQYLVIARGAERVAEVSARFALDALPGRQMSLDAAVRAGLADTATAARERQRLAEESGFHASMDGAMKFVRGDALAGALIAAVNLVGGAAVGVLHGERVTSALARYGALAVGQGLLAQVPSLLCAVAAALAVTRSESPEPVVVALGRALLGDRVACWTAAAMVLLVGALPGLPLAPFMVAGVALAALPQLTRRAGESARIVLQAPRSSVAAARELARSLSVEAESALGLSPPVVAVRAGAGWALAVDGVDGAILAGADDARRALREHLLRWPSRWFGVEESRAWLDRAARDAPALVAATVPSRLGLVELTALLQSLLDGGVPVAPSRAILEAIAASSRALPPAALLELVRAAMRRSTAARWSRDGTVRALFVGPLLADAVHDAASRSPEFTPGPALRTSLNEALAALGPEAPEVVVTTPATRGPLERALRALGASLVVLSFEEVATVAVERAGTLGDQ